MIAREGVVAWLVVGRVGGMGGHVRWGGWNGWLVSLNTF